MPKYNLTLAALPAPQIERLAVSVPEAAAMIGVSKTYFFTTLANKSIPTLKVGRRTLVQISVLRDWLSRQARPLNAA